MTPILSYRTGPKPVMVHLEYITEYGSTGDCPLCGEPIEHGQTRATIDLGHGETQQTHDHCAETQQQLETG